MTFATFLGFNPRIRFADIVETASADRAAHRASGMMLKSAFAVFGLHHGQNHEPGGQRPTARLRPRARNRLAIGLFGKAF
ncbi:hypothetical protein [Bosea lathyri]|uniref:hypothetical protein n=1 Tax=Bosea lathyri TaxID=1036778 RepID=UPI0011B086C2|nr:hypothetical protein [Bosea lathyri]